MNTTSVAVRTSTVSPVTASASVSAQPSGASTRGRVSVSGPTAPTVRTASGTLSAPTGWASTACLSFRSRFHMCSVTNALMIWMQWPTARYCMGFRPCFAPILVRSTPAETAAGADPDARTVVGYQTAVTFGFEQTEAVADDALVYVPPTPRLDTDAPGNLIRRLEAVAVSLRRFGGHPARG